MIKKSWTTDELEYLKKEYHSTPKKELAEKLNRTVDSIHGKAKRLGIQKPPRPWTIEEDNFLIDNYPNKGNKYCSDALDRTGGSINQRIQKLNLKSTVRQTKNMEVLSNWLADNKDIEFLEPFLNDRTKLLVKHTICGHIWNPSVNTLKKSRKAGNSGCPKCSDGKQHSSMAIKWIDSFSNPNIIHAENGGEKSFLNYKVDGYDPTTNTIYEFHGDVYHGNLDKFDPNYRCHPFDKSVTAEQLWQKTFNRMLELSKIATVIYIWENDYKNGNTYEVF